MKQRWKKGDSEHLLALGLNGSSILVVSVVAGSHNTDWGFLPPLTDALQLIHQKHPRRFAVHKRGFLDVGD